MGGSWIGMEMCSTEASLIRKKNSLKHMPETTKLQLHLTFFVEPNVVFCLFPPLAIHFYMQQSGDMYFHCL